MKSLKRAGLDTLYLLNLINMLHQKESYQQIIGLLMPMDKNLIVRQHQCRQLFIFQQIRPKIFIGRIILLNNKNPRYYYRGFFFTLILTLFSSIPCFF